MPRKPQNGAHFLLRASSRTLNLRDIYTGGEEKAFDTFCEIRWPDTDGEPVCPRCGCYETYHLKKYRRFKCRNAGCHHQFSPTSGTILHSRKMAYMDLLAAICLFVNAAKGMSSLQMARDIGCHPKSAWVLCHKIREALASEMTNETLNGTVEVDGQYHGGHVRPANRKADRIDRRKAENMSGKRRVVIVARERNGRTRTTVKTSESGGLDFVASIVQPGSIVHADEATHWDPLHAMYETKRINHQEAYSLHGACTNQAESYFARLRRMTRGQHHRTSPQHLLAYAAHAAWIEDHRRENNGSLAKRALASLLSQPISRSWKGYWQRSIYSAST